MNPVSSRLGASMENRWWHIVGPWVEKTPPCPKKRGWLFQSHFLRLQEVIKPRTTMIHAIISAADLKLDAVHCRAVPMEKGLFVPSIHRRGVEFHHACDWASVRNSNNVVAVALPSFLHAAVSAQIQSICRTNKGIKRIICKSGVSDQLRERTIDRFLNHDIDLSLVN